MSHPEPRTENGRAMRLGARLGWLTPGIVTGVLAIEDEASRSADEAHQRVVDAARDALTPWEVAAIRRAGDPPDQRRCVSCRFVVEPRGRHQPDCPIAAYLTALDSREKP